MTHPHRAASLTPPHKVGDNVVSILTDPRYATGVAFGMKGDLGIVSLDA
jgi:hypothetical protein